MGWENIGSAQPTQLLSPTSEVSDALTGQGQDK